MSIGKKIKKYRMENKMTQTDLGNAIGKSMSVIQKYELDKITPSLHVIEEIAKALNIVPTDIYLNDESTDLLNKYNELLIKHKDLENKNNCLKNKADLLLEENQMLKGMIKLLQEKLNK